jgi:hypothetical protein
MFFLQKSINLTHRCVFVLQALYQALRFNKSVMAIPFPEADYKRNCANPVFLRTIAGVYRRLTKGSNSIISPKSFLTKTHISKV